MKHVPSNFLTLFLSTLLCLTSAAHSTVLTAVDTGWYESNGTHNTQNENYVVGESAKSKGYAPVSLNNWLVFDVSTLTNITSAKLRMWNTYNGVNTVEAFETYALWDVTTNIADLTGGVAGVAGFNDLGSGISYGEINVNMDDRYSWIEIDLNTNALNAINGTTGLWAIGGSLTTIDFSTYEREYVFGLTSSSSCVELVVDGSTGGSTAPCYPPVPLPMSGWLFSSALLALGYRYRSTRPS